MTEFTYTVLSRAWYGPAVLRNRSDPHVVDEVSFGLSHPDGSVEWEACFEWRNLDNREPPAVQLRVFDEAWEGCALSGVFRAIGTAWERDRRAVSPTVGDVAAMLEGLGFRDATPETKP